MLIGLILNSRRRAPRSSSRKMLDKRHQIRNCEFHSYISHSFVLFLDTPLDIERFTIGRTHKIRPNEFLFAEETGLLMSILFTISYSWLLD